MKKILSEITPTLVAVVFIVCLCIYLGYSVTLTTFVVGIGILISSFFVYVVPQLRKQLKRES